MVEVGYRQRIESLIRMVLRVDATRIGIETCIFLTEDCLSLVFSNSWVSIITPLWPWTLE